MLARLISRTASCQFLISKARLPYSNQKGNGNNNKQQWSQDSKNTVQDRSKNIQIGEQAGLKEAEKEAIGKQKMAKQTQKHEGNNLQQPSLSPDVAAILKQNQESLKQTQEILNQIKESEKARIEQARIARQQAQKIQKARIERQEIARQQAKIARQQAQKIQKARIERQEKARIERQEKAKIESEKDRKENLKNAKWSIWNNWVLSALGIAGFFFGIYKFFFAQYVKIKKVLKKYGKVPLKIQGFQLSSNSTTQQMERILKETSNDVKIVLGMPGNGKSTELKKLVQQARDKGKKAYYINLREGQDEDQYQKGKIDYIKLKEKIQDLHLLIGGVNIFEKLPQNNADKAIVVIDDINMLQSMKIQDKELVKGLLYSITNIKRRLNNVIVVSSSSSFVKQLRRMSFVQKESDFYSIKNKSKDEKKDCADNMLKSFCNNDSQKIKSFQNVINYLVQNEASLRMIKKVAAKIPDNTPDSLQKKTIISIDQKKNQQLEILAQQSAKLKEKGAEFLKRTVIELVNQIIHYQIGKEENENLVEMKIKTTVYEKMLADVEKRKLDVNTGRMQVTINEFINIFDQLNLIFWGLPRSNFERQILKEFQKKLIK